MFILASSWTGFPRLSKGGAMTSVWSTDATIMKREASARCRPAHILDAVRGPGETTSLRKFQDTDLLPKPKKYFRGSLTFGLGLPSTRNRSGLNSSGSG